MESAQFKKQILGMSDKLFRLAKSMLRDDDAAKDAVQDLNMKLWEKRDVLDEVLNISAFTMQSMRNRCLDIIRQTHIPDELDSNLMSNEMNPYQRAEQSDMVKKIKMLIDRLPEMQRTAIRLRDVEEMEIREIAEIMEISESAVSANLSRARQRIREQVWKEQKQVEEKVWRT
jgi:RNA polymerase sigma-70 factor, ECF subfamily